MSGRQRTSPSRLPGWRVCNASRLFTLYFQKSDCGVMRDQKRANLASAEAWLDRLCPGSRNGVVAWVTPGGAEPGRAVGKPSPNLRGPKLRKSVTCQGRDWRRIGRRASIILCRWSAVWAHLCTHHQPSWLKLLLSRLHHARKTRP